MTQSRKEIPGHALHFDGARTRFNSRPHDIHNLYVSLKQWRILHAVIDCGGYAEAAKSLHLSQSTISYTISKLQDQLGVPILKIEGRKAILTNVGRALLNRSRQVLKEAIELENYAKNLGRGWGEEVQLVFDHNFPTQLLMHALNRFAEIGGGAGNVRLREVPVLQAEEVLRDQNVDIVVSERVPLGFLGEPLVEVEYIAVAHPEHPLFKLGRDITPSDLAQQVQIEIGVPSEGGGSGWKGSTRYMRRWVLSSFDTVVAAVRERHGYAWLPEPRVRKWLEGGELARLPLAEKCNRKTVLYLVHGHRWAATTAASRFAEVLRGAASGSCDNAVVQH